MDPPPLAHRAASAIRGPWPRPRRGYQGGVAGGSLLLQCQWARANLRQGSREGQRNDGERAPTRRLPLPRWRLLYTAPLSRTPAPPRPTTYHIPPTVLRLFRPRLDGLSVSECGAQRGLSCRAGLRPLHPRVAGLPVSISRGGRRTPPLPVHRIQYAVYRPSALSHIEPHCRRLICRLGPVESRTLQYAPE